MTDDPYVREIGRLEDDQGRVLIVGTDHDAVTLRTLHTRTSGAVTLGLTLQEELGQLLITACWQAGWQRCRMDAGTTPQDPAPAAPDLPIPQPGRAAQRPAGARASDSAAPAGIHPLRTARWLAA